MLKSVRVLLALAMVSGSVVLPGCGGGNSTIDGVAKYAGAYSGTFTGKVTSDNTPVSGTFTLVADSNGNITGTVTQPGVGSFPLSGTISSNGNVALTANPSSDEVTTVNGKVSNATTGALSATFVTKVQSQTVVQGTITGSRTSAK